MPELHFAVEVVAADRKLYQGDAVSLVLPGIDGYFGVLHGHAPLVSALRIGEIEITPPGDRPHITIAISSGFAEVTPDRVLVLADSAELAQEIDVARARAAVERAEQRLREVGSDIDFDRAQAALQRALNRLRVAERHL